MEIESKLPSVGMTIFTVMSQLAHESNAINLAQGFPSFNPPQELLERISFHLNDGANQYAPMAGVPSLRRAIAAKTQRLQGRALNTETEITVSTGATEGLFSVIQAVVRRGDEVIVFDPAYDSYEPAVALAGGITRHVPLTVSDNDGEFNVDWQLLSDAMSDKTRLIICNFPHNPTGALLSSDNLDQLAEIVRNTNAFLLSDEVYEHIVFDGRKHLSLASHDELWERSFIVSSFGKTFHATGWKVGYCLAPDNLTAEFRRVHQFTTFTVITPIQHALADFMESNPDFPEQLSTFYEQKRDLFCELLAGSKFRLKPARSTFFQMLDYRDVSPEADEVVAKKWTREIGVASIPISVFCEKPLTGQRLRFCFAKDDATLAVAVKKLRSL
jgi:methionine aminotransferase